MDLEVKECTAHRMDHTIVRMLVHPGLEPPNINYQVGRRQNLCFVKTVRINLKKKNMNTFRILYGLLSILLG